MKKNEEIKLWSLLGNSQKLDGGAMFGNAPKALWSRWMTPDSENRVHLACRCLLAQVGEKLILLETGIGNFFSEKYRQRFGVQENEHMLLRSLKEIGFSQEQITDVILSHLHFDHAGGVLTSYDEKAPIALLFPNAHYYVGKKAFARAKNPHFRDRASFIPQLPKLLEESGRLVLVEGGNSSSSSPSPSISFRESDGHTPGLILSKLQTKNHSLYFVSDLIPGSAWVHLPITMGYDRYPEMLIDEKESLLKECSREGSYLFYTHDPQIAMSKVLWNGEHGKYVPSESENELRGFSF